MFQGGYGSKASAALDLKRKLVAVGEGRSGAAPDIRTAPTLAELAEPWLKRREHTHRSWRDDASRWRCHLKPTMGRLRPSEVTHATIRAFVEAKVGEGLSPATTRLCVRLLSTLFADIVAQGHATANPVAGLPATTRKIMKPGYDPRTTPFLDSADKVRRVYQALGQPFATIFAIGALAGLRPGEALALEWSDIDMTARRITVVRQVRHGRVGPPKSGKLRFVPIIPALHAILAEHKLRTGGAGVLFPAPGPRKGYVGLHSVHEALRDALKACGLPPMKLYEAGRHTFASLHVRGGGSMLHLRELMGHSSVQVTERYAHLAPGALTPADMLQTGGADFTRAGADVVDLQAHRAKGAVEAQPMLTSAAEAR